MKIATIQLGKPYVWGAKQTKLIRLFRIRIIASDKQIPWAYKQVAQRPILWDRGGTHTSYFDRIAAGEIRRSDIVRVDTGYTYPGDIT